MIQYILPQVLVKLASNWFESRRNKKRILELRKEIASTLADASLSDDMRSALILDLRKQINSLLGKDSA